MNQLKSRQPPRPGGDRGGGSDRSREIPPTGSSRPLSDAAEGVRASLSQLLSAIVFLSFIGGWFIANCLVRPPELLLSERRAPARLPALTWTTLASAQFMNGFEDYAADSFAGREALRSLKAWTVLGPWCQLDKSGIYRGAVGVGRFQRLDAASVQQVGVKIARLAEQLPELKPYYAFIPDKSVYAGHYVPGFDPVQAGALLAAELPRLTAIDLTATLGAADFYTTDLHWDQSHLQAVVDRLTTAMAVAPVESAAAPVAVGEFRGVYAGQLALPVAPDTMTYVPQANLRASYLDPQTLTWEPGPVYDLAAVTGLDPYDLFLGGAQPLVRLDNPAAQSGRELFIFRDSFASSLAPLLAATYDRVWLIDLRYIAWRLVGDFVEFSPGADVLFLYSSQILNSSTVLLVD